MSPWLYKYTNKASFTFTYSVINNIDHSAIHISALFCTGFSPFICIHGVNSPTNQLKGYKFGQMKINWEGWTSEQILNDADLQWFKSSSCFREIWISPQLNLDINEKSTYFVVTGYWEKKSNKFVIKPSDPLQIFLMMTVHNYNEQQD